MEVSSDGIDYHSIAKEIRSEEARIVFSEAKVAKFIRLRCSGIQRWFALQAVSIDSLDELLISRNHTRKCIDDSCPSFQHENNVIIFLI